MFGKICIFVTALFIFGCSGGSDSTSNAPSGESSVGDYAENISYTTTETVKRAISSESSPISLKSSRKADVEKAIREIESLKINSSSVKIIQSESDTVLGDCGGVIISVTTTTTPDNSELIFPISISYEADYQNYCVGNEEFNIVLNGSFLYDFNYLSFDEYSSLYRYDLSYSSNYPLYPSGTISENEHCIKEKDKQEVCTSTFLYDSTEDGRYTLTEVDIEGSSSSGYNISGVLTDEGNNIFNINVSNLTQCNNGNIQTGEIEIEANNGAIVSISFPNCNEFVISYQGVSETFPQN